VASYSTAEAAKAAGVTKRTLLRWLEAGKVNEPRRVTFAGQESRVWSDADLRRLKKYAAENYQEGKGKRSPR
jgi:DNA-binding transcriptional MerR regulator